MSTIRKTTAALAIAFTFTAPASAAVCADLPCQLKEAQKLLKQQDAFITERSSPKRSMILRSL